VRGGHGQTTAGFLPRGSFRADFYILIFFNKYFNINSLKKIFCII